MTIIDQANLYYRAGTSDKEYHLTLEEVPGGHIVNFSYGRRGSALKDGTKTASPVSLTSARKVFDDVYNEKTGKGYRPGAGGRTVVAPHVPTASTDAPIAPNVAAAPAMQTSAVKWLPQLLNPIEEANVANLIADPDWGMQEKHDGENRIIGLAEDLEPFATNRDGKPVGLEEEAAENLRRLGKQVGQVVLAGEAMGGYVVCHDLLLGPDGDLRPRQFLLRYITLAQEVAPHFDGALRLSRLARTPADKDEIFTHLKVGGAEGVVFKRLSAPFTAGRPASGGDQLKVKFWKTASAIVAGLNDKSSFAVALLNENGALVNVGNVTLPPNKPRPAVGDLVEVRYLYAYRGGSLYQPFYLRPRDDITRETCTLAQLKYKAEPKTLNPASLGKPTGVHQS